MKKAFVGGQAVIEGIMMNIMYEIPSLGNVKKCIITPEAVEKTEKPRLVYSWISS